ncbi:MAG: DUF2202 domain-containing protein [Rhodoferax sp.]|uniref:DUF2202 domain-containing protein n=1 Tax=Rhodoferax sp. TaxID=50421 RepID=UPI002721AEFA|nr:DUF2202 domain-containing protein [Rhodoferax sp.]MDO8449334.1 DUF2202 domain-containing protein [Rhodoferax sp.]
MKRKQFLRYTGAALSVAALGPVLTACGGGSDFVSTAPAATVGILSPEEIAGLKFMREEEKLAHDVYVYLYGLWGANPNATVFSLIALSETTHTEAILALLVKYGIADPAAGKLPGEFTDPALQTLYNTLIGMGQVSLIEALKVGALIEETDIHDINAKKAVTDEVDIVQVYDSLLCGSRNHLRAFNTQLLALGVTYVPTVITQAEWDAIANALPETCGG